MSLVLQCWNISYKTSSLNNIFVCVRVFGCFCFLLVQLNEFELVMDDFDMSVLVGPITLLFRNFIQAIQSSIQLHPSVQQMALES